MEEIKKGVYLGITPSKKYKTNQIIIKLIVPYSGKVAAERGTISRMMEDGSSKIHSKGMLEQQLATLYGANLQVTSQRKGYYHEVTLTTTAVNPRLVQNHQFVSDWLALIQDLLWEQKYLLDDQSMHERFIREQRLLIQMMKRQQDNKQRYVGQKLAEKLYAEDPELAKGGFGSITDVEQLNYEDIASAYQTLVETSAVYVQAHGDWDAQLLKKWVRDWPLSDRSVQVDYQHNVISLPKQAHFHQEESVPGVQANIAIAYQLPPSTHIAERHLIQLANAIFSSAPTSKLFTEIREKQSLAYSISGSVDFTRDLLIVRAGVEPKHVHYVVDQVNEQLKIMQNTLVDQEMLSDIKLALKSYELQMHDTQHFENINGMMEYLYPDFNLTSAHYEEVIDRLTAKDVQMCCQKWQYIGAYSLVGGDYNG